MSEIETDYLVIGAGASGMSFVDALVAASKADVVIVDRHHSPGGHWNDDYSFLRLHQPSAFYGVNSLTLGQDRIDEFGQNAGFYERATAAEVREYYRRVLDEVLLPTGRVRFLGMHDYIGETPQGHQVVSRLSGETSIIRPRKLVDATYIATTIPSKHTPRFRIENGTRLVTPNDLTALDEAGSGYTIIGAGKTSMDTICWLVDNGVSPDAIRWIRPRDPWTLPRAMMQPLDLIGSITTWLANQAEAAAQATDREDLFRRLEEAGALARIDPAVEPSVYRGPILGEHEMKILRSVRDVVRLGHVVTLGTHEITLEQGSIPTDARMVHVDCTAPGVGLPSVRPVFEPGRITIQRVQFGIDPFNGAFIGHVEATRDDDEVKNRLCPPIFLSGDAADAARAILFNLRVRAVWMTEPDINAWVSSSRLTPFKEAGKYLKDPESQAAMVRLIENSEAAVKNLERIFGE